MSAAVGSAVEVLTPAGWQVHATYVTHDEAMVACYELVHASPGGPWYRVVSL